MNPETIAQWIKDRIAERSTWDGGVIVGISVAVLATAPFIKYMAICGIVYGSYRIYQKEFK